MKKDGSLFIMVSGPARSTMETEEGFFEKDALSLSLSPARHAFLGDVKYLSLVIPVKLISRL